MRKIEEVLSCDPDTVSGAVVFRGTRVPVSALFENLADGLNLHEFLESFPGVERQQAEDALLIACSLLQAEFA